MNGFPYRLQESGLPRLGVIVLQADETIENDLRHLFRPDIAEIFVTRVPSGRTLTPDTIAEMETAIPAATALLPDSAPFAAVAYACTSGTALIGPERVAHLVQSATHTPHVTNPLTAALAAFSALGVDRIGIVSPYVPTVSAGLREAFVAGGLSVPETLSFGEETEARVARIAPASIAKAARTIAARGRLDGLFLSCTNLKTLDILSPLEKELGMPVLASNQVLAWHMCRLAGLPTPSPEFGSLMAT